MHTHKTPSIKLLPPLLQNQIAAGEVVERPAGVLKELVENSLDAGATAIEVTLEDGGQRLLVVTDNGKGMSAEELPLALTRHATSKIADFTDLLNVSSYGFRGEALPSIASVACIAIHSCPKGDNQGTFINVRYGELENTGPTVIAQGTTVQVADLFMNVPARLKFLKTPATELKRCQDVLLRLALARPDVAFSLFSNGKEAFTFPKDTPLAHRLAVVWPPSITENLLPVHHTRNDILVKGLVSHPQNSQARADRLFFYVNNRPVQDKLLISAVREAYKGRLISREYPQAALFITIDPQEIDVNVHPAKTEIRFRDERAIFSSVHRAITMALQEVEENLFSPQPENSANTTREALQGLQNEVATNQSFQGELTAPHFPPLYNGHQPHGFWGQADAPRLVDLPTPNFAETTEVVTHNSSHPQPSFITAQNNTFTAPTLAENTSYFSGIPNPAFPVHTAEKSMEHVNISQGYPIAAGAFICLGQLAKSYLILMHNNDLLILDQHAAHEQVLIESFARDRKKIGSQLLALPEPYPLHSEETTRFKELLPKLTHLGFTFESITEEVATLNGIPDRLGRGDALQLFKDMLIDKQEGMDNLFHMLACRAAIKAGDILTADEAAKLLEKWVSLGTPYYCPHGRPIVLRYTTATLEKLFKRNG